MRTNEVSRTTATSAKEFQDRAGDGRNIKFGDGNCIGLLLHTTQSFTTFCLHKILVHYASCYFGVPFHFSLRKILRTHRNGFTPSSHTIKNTITNAIVFFMGRVMGIEPTNIGTTIRGLNRLATPAISSLTLKQTNLFFNYHFFYLQYYKNAHILD